ncbi:MAG: FG-GAP repeat protein [bacterium]
MRRVCRAGLRRLSIVLLPIAMGAAHGGAAANTLDLRHDADFVFHGPWYAGRTGSALAAGDFDGDGIGDIAVGSPRAEVRAYDSEHVGAIHLLFGGADFRDRHADGLTNAATKIRGTREGQGVGGFMASGDFNGDGKSDLLVGSPWTTESDSLLTEGGAAYLILGRARGEFPAELLLPDSADAVFVPGDRGVHLGEGVALGDFDGDGRDDAAIGALHANGPDGVRIRAGAVYVYLGREKKKTPRRISIANAADLTIHGSEREDTAGRSIAFTDWNADRREDLVIGADFGDGPFNTRVDPGEAHLVLGRDRKQIGKLGKKRIIDLSTPGASMPCFGAHTRGSTSRPLCAGDLDGDEFGDIVIASQFGPEVGPRAQTGIVDVLFGGFVVPEAIDLAGPAEFRVVGKSYFDHAGACVQTGDLNGDGRDELFVGAPLADPFDSEGVPRLSGGEIGVVMGRPKAQFPDTLDLQTAEFDHVIKGADEEDNTPGAIDVVDIDADGKADLIVGSPGTQGKNNTFQHAGEIYFFLGASREW